MRHHTTSIVGPDIDDSNHPATPDSCPPPAQPSVGEKLAQVCYEAFHNGNPPEGYPHFTPWFLSAALAVRREVLSEPFTDEDVKAADKAFKAFRGGGRTDWIRAALSAAIASRVARESKVTT